MSLPANINVNFNAEKKASALLGYFPQPAPQTQTIKIRAVKKERFHDSFRAKMELYCEKK
jgi:hypothetical protein